MLHVIVTADDFGLDLAINEAVEQAFCGGLLTAASLMVGQPAARDAVERARRLPGFRVGLHVTLTGARPVLDPALVPDLVDASGRLGTRLPALGMRLAVSGAARRQAEAEIRAQFPKEVAEPLPTADGVMVAVVEKREPPDPAHAEANRASLDERVLRGKRTIIFYEWLRERRRVAGVEPPVAS